MYKEKMTKRQVRVFHLLQSGKYSVMQIANQLFIGDPRSVIRNMRKMGIEVKDEWIDTKSGDGRYKRYWIENGGQQ